MKRIFDFTMSVQSMDAGVLEEVKRKNIPPSKYKAAGEYLRKKGRDSLVEIIVPLPKESLKTYFQGMKDLMAWKVSRIVSNTIMFLNGTEFKNKEYIDKFGYKSKFRLIPRQFGIYGGDKVYEIEEVGIATNSMSFEDYLETRKFGFITEMLFNSRILREVELFVDDCKLNYYDFVFLVYKNLENSHPHIKGVMDSFIKQSVSELKDSEELLINYYSEDNNFKKLVSGDEGGNLKYSHKAMLLFKHKDIWLEFVFDCLKKFLLENNVEVDKQFDDIVEFTKCKLEGVMDRSKTNVEVKKSFNFDVVTWVNQEDRAKPLKEFKNGSKIKIKFAYDTNQIRERNVIFDKFKNNDAFDMTNILVSIRPQHKVFRKFALDKA